MIELSKREKNPMIRHILSIASSAMLFILGLGLIGGLFVLIYPARPGQVSFGPAVNVAATAQAIQAHNRQAELETTLEMKRVAWELELVKKQQEVSAELDSAAKKQLNHLQAKFLSLQSELNQTNLALQTNQFKVRELQNAIQADAAELTTWEEKVKQLTDDLDQTKARLQMAADTLASQQAANQTPETVVPPQTAIENGSNDPSPAPSDSANDDHREESDSEKPNAERSEDSEDSKEHHEEGEEED